MTTGEVLFYSFVRKKCFFWVKVLSSVTCNSDRKTLSPSKATTFWTPEFSRVLVNTPGPKANTAAQFLFNGENMQSRILYNCKSITSHNTFSEKLAKRIPGLHSKIIVAAFSGRRCCVISLAKSGFTIKCLIFLQDWARRTLSSNSPRSRKSYRHRQRWPWTELVNKIDVIIK